MGEKSETPKKIVGLVLLGFSVLYLCSGFCLKIGTLESPGPGFFPLVVGTCLTALTIALVIRTFRPKPSEKAATPFAEEICRVAEGGKRTSTVSGNGICKDVVTDEVPVPCGEEPGKEKKVLVLH